MRHIVRWTVFAAAVTLLAAPPLFAQSAQSNQGNQNAPKPKKLPNQVPETGPNDPDSAATSTFERTPENLLPVTVRPDGTVMMQLDETYMEASVVRLGADGTLTFEHYAGLPKASAAAALLPARALPLVFPILEEKE